MDFSIMFWGNVRSGAGEQEPYRLLLETAKYADENGYAALWIPERHFHPWGALYPNPSVVCAALATITKRIRLRAGSVVVPLHHPIRVAEEWSVVDNLSGGRVELSVASGWKADDFVLNPEAYADRRDGMWNALETIQKLWRGGEWTGKNPVGQDVAMKIFPRPVQRDLPLWVTSAGSVRTMTDAADGGFGLLTHLLGQDFDELEKRVGQYRAYRTRAKLEGDGRVSLMLHTLVGNSDAEMKELAREPLTAYLRESADLAIPANQRAQWDSADAALKSELMSMAFERYFETAGLMGSQAKCRAIVERAQKLGVTDICCLVDFGLPTDVVLDHLKDLTAVKNAVNG